MNPKIIHDLCKRWINLAPDEIKVCYSWYVIETKDPYLQTYHLTPAQESDWHSLPTIIISLCLEKNWMFEIEKNPKGYFVKIEEEASADFKHLGIAFLMAYVKFLETEYASKQ